MKSNKRQVIENWILDPTNRDTFETQILDAIEKDDGQTPAIWPGEESVKLKKKMQELADKCYNLYESDNDTCLHNVYDACYFAMQELSSWLKSHTAAPKAEGPHRSAEEKLIKEDVLKTVKEYVDEMRVLISEMNADIELKEKRIHVLEVHLQSLYVNPLRKKK